MDSIERLLDCETRPATLVVFLPGAYDKPQDFIDQSFVQALRNRQIQADILLVDAHVGYYTAQQVIERLDRDVISPAISRGYQNIWLVGISIGGFGSLLYSEKFPEKISGLFVMAPYMGARSMPSEIKRQVGLMTWQPDDPINPDTAFWLGLKRYATEPLAMPQAYIGYGSSDRFEAANRLFADLLPPAHRFAIAGGHDWRTWLQLWNDFLDVAPWPRAGAAVPNCVLQ